MATRASRACDGCRFRKVKCNGASPCSQCAHLGLQCVVSSAPRKRKPGVRGRLVAQLRQGAGPNPLPAPTGNPITQLSPSQTSPPGYISGSFNGHMPTSEQSPTSGSTSSDIATTPKPGRSPYSHDFFTKLLPDFDEIVYPVNPIITHDEIVGAIENMHNSFEDAALVYAFGAVTINLAQTSWTHNRDVVTQMSDLMELSFEAHRRADLGSKRNGGILGELPVSVKRIMTCVYLEICMMAFKRYDRSSAILREAISMIQIMQVHQNVPNRLAPEPCENARRQRLYWEMFIHERFLTITAGHPSVLKPLPSPPSGDTNIPLNVSFGWNCLVRLFSVLDFRFLELWSAQAFSIPAVSPVTAEWVEAKQAELDQDEKDMAASQAKMAMSGQPPLSELQLADVFITRLWLRTLVWQIALSSGLVHSDPSQTTHEALSLHFPVRRLSAQLRSLVARLDSVASIGTHGSGILEKLFEITSTVADVLALPTAQSKTHCEEAARMEDFVFLVQFLLGFERVYHQQKEYIREKMEILRKQYVTVDFGPVYS